MSTLPYEEQLQKIFSNINDWLKFAELKNFGFLTLNAAIVFGISQIKICANSDAGKVIWVFISFACLSFLCSLISLLPIASKFGIGNKSLIYKLCNWTKKDNKFENIHFYGYLKDINESKFEAEFLAKTNSTDAFSQFEKELVTQILYNSRITWVKYQLFKISTFLFLIGIAGFFITIGIIKLFS